MTTGRINQVTLVKRNENRKPPRKRIPFLFSFSSPLLNLKEDREADQRKCYLD